MLSRAKFKPKLGFKKGLFYCQYLFGLGHLVRSLHLCRSLIKDFEIDFLLGGHDLGLTLESPQFHLHPLPAIGFSDPMAENSEENFELQKQRLAQRAHFIDQLDDSYDFFITELFPFGKWVLKEEVQALIDKVKQKNPKALVFCSLRDSFTPLETQEKEVLEFIQKNYDAIFLHSDPRIFQLNESFSMADQIADKLQYSGFILNPETSLAKKPRQKRIVVSIGAGSFGHELLFAANKVAQYFTDYKFLLVIGPKTQKAVSNQLAEAIEQSGASNVSMIPFVENFSDLLNESALSISLGGYTIIDAAATHTPSLVLPWQFFDQYVRAIKFQAFHFLRIITLEELAPAPFSKAIREALAFPPSPFKLNTSGSETTTRFIHALLK